MGVKPAGVVVAIVVVAVASAACAAPFAMPADSAGPQVVLERYLAALAAGECDAGRRLATATFTTGNGELCGHADVTAYRLDPGMPAQPSANEVVFSVQLTTGGTDDGSVRPGQTLWFYSLARQPNGAWRLTGGGTGP